MSSPPRRPAIFPPPSISTRLVGAILRCGSCGIEWRSHLDAQSAVPLPNLNCPRCGEKKSAA